MSSCGFPHDRDPGNLAVEVFLPQDVTLEAMTYLVNGNGVPPITEEVLISGTPPTTSALFARIPPGSYEVSTNAASTDALTSCEASAPATVWPDRTSNLFLYLTCERPANGTVIVVGRFRCTEIASLLAAPAVATVGEDVSLEVDTITDAGSPTFSWTASTGAFADASAGVTTFRCSAPGPASITVVVAIGDCQDQESISVNCLPLSPDDPRRSGNLGRGSP